MIINQKATFSIHEQQSRPNEVGETSEVRTPVQTILGATMDRGAICLEDPRGKSNRYSKGIRTKFDPDQIEFEPLQFLIDEHYLGQPPRVQVSIDNLNDNINENFLMGDLIKLGKVRNLEIIRDSKGTHLGMAKVQFEQVSAAERCVTAWNNKDLMGRQLRVFEDPRFAKIERIKDEKLNPRPAPPPTPTISTITPFSTFSTPVISTSEPSSRPRLDDRIASLMMRPNSMLGTIVPQPQMPATFCEQPKNTHYNDRRPETNILGNISHYSNYKEPYHRYNRNDTNRSGEYRPTSIDAHEDWNIPIPPREEITDITISESQLNNHLLPYSFEEFSSTIVNSLKDKIVKQILIEKHGYPILERNQREDKAKRDQERLRRDKEELAKKETEMRRFEEWYYSKDREPTQHVEQRRVIQPSYKRTNAVDQPENSRPMAQRINRSAAMDTERRGSHNTIDGDSDSDSPSLSSSLSSSRSSSDSDDDSDDDRDSDSSSSSCSSSSFSGSSSRQSSLSSRSSISRRRKKQVATEEAPSSSRRLSHEGVQDEREEDAVSSLLLLKHGNEASSDDIVKRFEKPVGNKRKRKIDESLKSVASEYRAAKRFASDPDDALGPLNENIENAMYDDENYLRDVEIEFPRRSEIEINRMLYDLHGTLSEEDLMYLKEVHTKEGLDSNKDIEISPGSDEANKVHLAMKRDVIEPGMAKSMYQPKWWNGCSRCSVIPTDQRDKPSEDEGMDYADLTMAPIKSHVIQAATTSSRRDARGDQRRIAASNPEIGDQLLRPFISNSLAVMYSFQLSIFIMLLNKQLICIALLSTTDESQKSQVFAK